MGDVHASPNKYFIIRLLEHDEIKLVLMGFTLFLVSFTNSPLVTLDHPFGPETLPSRSPHDFSLFIHLAI